MCVHGMYKWDVVLLCVGGRILFFKLIFCHSDLHSQILKLTFKFGDRNFCAGSMASGKS